MKETQLWDLVEFRYSSIHCAFIKVQTLMTNLPKAICYAEKKKQEFLNPRSKTTRFIVVKNGTYQYNNQFKNQR